MPSQIMIDCCLCWLTRTRGHDRLIKINKILININKILHRPLLDLHGTGGRGLLSWPFGAQDDEVDCWVIHHHLLNFHGTGGRWRRPWPCKRASLSRTVADGPYVAVETMAGSAQDDELFCKKLPWWIVDNTSTPARFSGHRQKGASPMALSTRALERNGRGGPIGGGRSHGWRRPG